MEKKYEKLSEPLQVGSFVARNRIWFAPIWSRFASVDGEVTRTLIDHYEARARGGAGMICQEGTAVDGNDTWIEPQIAIHHDKYIAGLGKIVQAVHRWGCPIVCQIHHAGMFGTNPVSPSGVAAYDFGLSRYRQPRVLSIGEIEEITEKFGDAALRAKEAGYDGVEVHGATAYLLEQFISPHNNKRTDKYGGSLENRMLFPLEVVRNIRKKVGPDYTVGFTTVHDDREPGGGGINPEETVIYAKALEREGISYFDLQVMGTYETFHLANQPGLTRRHDKGAQLEFSQIYKKALKIPVTTRACSDNNPAVWEEGIASGKADAIRSGRGIIADPDLPNKILGNKVEDVRFCIVCCECLQTGVFDKLACNCSVNYGLGRGDRKVQPAPKVKNVLVVGGGPGGLEAARVSSLRGHHVTLMEKKGKLGGEVGIAALSTKKDNLQGFIDWQERQCRKLGVEIELNKEVTAKIIEALKPDVIFLATGAEPFKPPLPGIEKPHAVTADTVFLGKTKVGKKVVVAGGEMVGLEVSEFIISKGLAKDVTLVDRGPMSSIGEGMTGIDLAYWFTNVFPKLGLNIIPDTALIEITDKGVVVEDKKWKRYELEADTVVLALGYRSNQTLLDAIKGSGIAEIYTIGDALNPRNIMGAVHDASFFALQI